MEYQTAYTNKNLETGLFPEVNKRYKNILRIVHIYKLWSLNIKCTFTHTHTHTHRHTDRQLADVEATDKCSAHQTTTTKSILHTVMHESFNLLDIYCSVPPPVTNENNPSLE